MTTRLAILIFNGHAHAWKHLGKWMLLFLYGQIDSYSRDHYNSEQQPGQYEIGNRIPRHTQIGLDFCGIFPASAPSPNCQCAQLPELAAEVGRGDCLRSLFVFMDERVLISTNDKLLPFISKDKWIVLGPNASLTSTCTRWRAGKQGLCSQHRDRTKSPPSILQRTLQSGLKTWKVSPIFLCPFIWKAGEYN